MKKYALIFITLLTGSSLGFSTASATIMNYRTSYFAQNNGAELFIQTADTAEPFWVKTVSSVRLFRDMDNISSVILYIPSGETVEVFEEIDNYYSAGYQGEKGYILKGKVKPLNFSEPAGNSRVAKAPPPQKMNEKDRFAYLMSKYDRKTADALFKHQIWKGMSDTMAKDSWGAPLTMDRYLRRDEKYEEWKYSKYVLVFYEGQLSEWRKR